MTNFDVSHRLLAALVLALALLALAAAPASAPPAQTAGAALDGQLRNFLPPVR